MKKGRVLALTSIMLICVGVIFAAGNVEQMDAGKSEKIKLTYWTFLNPADSAPRSIAQNTIIEEFEKANPNIEVDVQVLGWAEIGPRIIRSVAAGNPPDVTRVASDSLAQQFAAKTLMDMTPFVGATGNAEAFIKDSVLDYTLDMDNGAKRAMWIDNRAVMLYYNKSHLAEIGLTEPPKSWDEVGKVAQKLTEKGHIGMAIGLSFGGSGNGFVEWFKPAIWSAGGDLLDENGNAAFNGPAGVRAMQMLYDFVNKYNCIPEEILSTDVDGIFQGFLSGRVSMLCFANHRYTTAQEALGADNVGIMRLPSFDGVEPAPAHVTGWMLAIPKGSAHPEEAWKFIQHVTSSESMVINAKIGGELATKNSSFEDPWFSTDPVGKQMSEWRDYILNFGRMPQFPEDYLRLQEILCNTAQRIVFEKAPIQATLNTAAEEYNSGRK